MSNIHIVNFDRNFYQQTVIGFTQYSRGQILKIYGLDLPPAIEIDFSLTETGDKSKPSIATTKNKVTEVKIPDFIFDNNAIKDYKGYAFIRPSNVNHSETTHKIVMEIKSIPNPEIPCSTEDRKVFDELVGEINNRIIIPETGNIGDVVSVEEVDKNGKPTKFNTKPIESSQLTQEQINALDEMFKVCAYKESPITQYEAFKKAFGISEEIPEPPVEKTWKITNILTNVKNSNNSISIKKNASYTAKLTADSGYTLIGGTIIITMNDVNITNTVYKNGDINIASVTGDIIINATSVEEKTPTEPSIINVDLTGKFDMDGFYYDPKSNSVQNQVSGTPSYSKGMSKPVILLPHKKYTLITIVPNPFNNIWTRCGIVAEHPNFPEILGGREMRTDKPLNLSSTAKVKFEDIGTIEGIQHAKCTFIWTTTDEPLNLFTVRSAKIKDSQCQLFYEE